MSVDGYKIDALQEQKMRYLEAALLEVGYDVRGHVHVYSDVMDYRIGVDSVVPIPRPVLWRAFGLIGMPTGHPMSCLACYEQWPLDGHKRATVCLDRRIGPQVLDCGAER